MCPEVSVVIPTYNRRAMVCEAIASVRAQRGAKLELIVIDDGSTDRTADEVGVIAALANAECADRMSMRLVRTGNRGVAAARNTGVAMASAPLLAFLDSDDLWMPHKLERQLAFMHTHGELAVAQTEEIWMRGGRRVNPGVRHRKRAGDIFLDSLRTCLISPSAVIMRIELFRELGGFDERLTAAEDYDLWLRILAEGHEVGLIEEPLVTRRSGDSMAPNRGIAEQLSATVPAIDRFRILALLKLLADDELDATRRPDAPQRLDALRGQAVCAVLAEKCAVYAQGLRRRGRDRDASSVAEIGGRVSRWWRESDGISIEDAIARMLSIIFIEASGAVPEASGVVAETDA